MNDAASESYKKRMSARTKISLLTFFFALCMTAAVITAYRDAQAEVKPAELYAVVERQLQELRGGDYEQAYANASRNMQQQYSPGEYAAIFEHGCCGALRPVRAEYGEVEARGGRAMMQVYMIGEDGQVMPCVYSLVREADGWRIDGARLMAPWPADMRMDATLL